RQGGVSDIGRFGPKVIVDDAHLVLEINRVIAIVSEIVPEGSRLDAGNNCTQVAAGNELSLRAQSVGFEILPESGVGRVRGPTHFGQPDRPRLATGQLNLLGDLLEILDEDEIVQLSAVRM